MGIVWYLIGWVIGAATIIVYRYLTYGTGTLRIDHFNPEKDTYRFEIDNLESINKKKKILLVIDHNADLSQE